MVMPAPDPPVFAKSHRPVGTSFALDSRPFGPAESNVSCSLVDDANVVDEVVEMLTSLADEEGGDDAVETLLRRCRDAVRTLSRRCRDAVETLSRRCRDAVVGSSKVRRMGR